MSSCFVVFVKRKINYFVFTCIVVETTDDGFKLYLGDEAIDFPLLVEKLLATNNENFPIVMEFLKMNIFVPKLSETYSEIGYTFINSHSFANEQTKWRLKSNLIYLKENKCDLNLEMFNFLRSLTFGGKVVKRGENFLEILKILIPFCTDFFIDKVTWKKIRYFCGDTEEIKEALKFLINNYGTEVQYKFLPPLPKYEPFSLKHLARNKNRENVWKNKTINLSFLACCKDNLPVTLFKYMKFEN